MPCLTEQPRCVPVSHTHILWSIEAVKISVSVHHTYITLLLYLYGSLGSGFKSFGLFIKFSYICCGKNNLLDASFIFNQILWFP